MYKNIGGGEKEFADQGAKDFRPHGLGGLVRLSKAGVGHVFGMKKCVEDAKIGTLRADWRGEWVSLGVDLLNIKRNGVGGGFLKVFNRSRSFGSDPFSVVPPRRSPAARGIGEITR